MEQNGDSLPAVFPDVYEDASRERDALRYFQPWSSTYKSPGILQAVSVTAGADTERVKSPLGSQDTALAAFAQLGALRLNAQRCMVILYGKEHEYVLAEATRTLSLQSDATHNTNDELWIGTASYPRKHGTSSIALPTWQQNDAPRALPPRRDQYHTAAIDPHFLVIDDLHNQKEAYHAVLPQFRDAIRFVAGVPIRSRRHNVIGAYIIIDGSPRYGLSEAELVFMEDMSRTIMNHLDSTRAAMQKVSAERLIKGLGVFEQGGSSLRDWYIRSLQREAIRGRRQEQQSTEENATYGDQADDEFGESSLQRLQKMASRDGHNTRLGPPGNPSELRKQLMNNLAADTSTTSKDFASDKRSDQEIVDPADKQAREDAQVKQAADFDLEKASRDVFVRASNLIREAMGAEGVLFLDAGFTNVSVGKRSASISSLSNSSVTSTSSLSSESDDALSREDISDGAERATSTRNARQPKKRHGKKAPSCPIFGFSTRVRSSLRAFEAPKTLQAFPQVRMEKLLKRYPQGRIFNFQEGGALYPSSASGDEESNPLQHEKGHQSTPVVIHPDEITEHRKGKEKDAKLLSEMLPGVTSVVYLPMWDAHREKWRAGAFIWSTTPGRFFSQNEDLHYIAAFANSISAQLTRLDTLAADHAKGTFIASVSHELRSPLHGILAGCDFLVDSDLTPFQHEMATTVRIAGVTLLDTIDTILDYTKINQGTSIDMVNDRHASDDQLSQKGRICNGHNGESVASTIDLSVLTENVVSTVVTGQQYRASRQSMIDQDSGTNGPLDRKLSLVRNNVQVILHIKYSLAWNVAIDPGAWTRVVGNLLSNALKYTTDGYVHVSLQTVKNKVLLAVQDTGGGISERHQKHHLFMPFRQEDSHASGIGLGLYLVKQIVDGLGGTIEVESTKSVARGTKMLVTIPFRAMSASTGASCLIHTEPGRKDSRPLQVAMLRSGSLTQSSPTPNGVSHLKMTQKDMLQSSAAHTCSEWLGAHFRAVGDTSLLDQADPDTDVFLMTEGDFTSWWEALPTRSGRRRATGPRLLVLTHAFGSPLGRQDIEDVLGQCTFIDPPLGPRKMARTFNAVMQPQPDQQSPPRRPTHPTSPRLTSRYNSFTTPEKPRLRTERSDGSAKSDTSISSPVTGKKLLLVDDNGVNLRLLVAWARKLRRPYIEATNGLEAVRAYEREADDIDGVLMDISMPVMDGFAATRAIREFEGKGGLPRCLIIALTGVASRDARENARASGLDVFVPKPASFATVKGLLEGEADVGEIVP